MVFGALSSEMSWVEHFKSSGFKKSLESNVLCVCCETGHSWTDVVQISVLVLCPIRDPSVLLPVVQSAAENKQIVSSQLQNRSGSRFKKRTKLCEVILVLLQPVLVGLGRQRAVTTDELHASVLNVEAEITALRHFLRI